MLTVVVWKWGTQYTAQHVNQMATMVGKHYDRPHRVLCVTNDAAGIDSSVQVVPDREDFATVASPHGRSAPSCFRRLRMFAPDAAEVFGERFVSVDLDAVVVGDLVPLWDRSEDFVGWRDPMRPRQLNGSMMLLRAGMRSDVWSDFDPRRSPQQALAAGFRGSDQGWISSRMQDVPRWAAADGVLSYKVDVLGRGLPANARVVFFHGRPKPWELSHNERLGLHIPASGVVSVAEPRPAEALRHPSADAGRGRADHLGASMDAPASGR